MNAINFIKKMEHYKKDYYTLSDLVKLAGISRRSLKVRINRMVKRGFITRAARDIYTLPGKSIDVEKVAGGLVTPSYFSFDYILAKKGVISETPYVMELVTLKRTRSKNISGVRVVYRYIKKSLFFGFTMSGGVCFAEAEKALLDSVYFRVYGKGTGVLKANKKRINSAKLKKYMSKYPKRVNNYLKNTGVI